MRPLKLAIGLLLLPACAGLTRGLFGVAGEAAADASAWWTWAAFLIGLSLWVFLFFLLPRPTRAYVLGHELTHALWSVLMLGGFSKLRVRASGGSVMTTKNNVWITLAPYFFPFYTMLLVAACGVAAHFHDQTPWRSCWMFAFGVSWGFHITFTVTLLAIRQTDILENGRLFSYVVIYGMNLLAIVVALVVTSSAVTLAGAGRRVGEEVGHAYRAVGAHAAALLPRGS